MPRGHGAENPLWGMTVLSLWAVFRALFCKDSFEFWHSAYGQSPQAISPDTMRPGTPSPTSPPSLPHSSPPFLSLKGKAATWEAATHSGLQKEGQAHTGKHSGENRKETEKHWRENSAGERGVPISWVLGRGPSLLTHAVGSHGNLLGKLLHKRIRAEGKGRKRFENLKKMPQTQGNICQKRKHSSRRRHALCLETHILPHLSSLLLLRGELWLICFHNICHNICQYATNAVWIITMTQCKQHGGDFSDLCSK